MDFTINLLTDNRKKSGNNNSMRSHPCYCKKYRDTKQSNKRNKIKIQKTRLSHEIKRHKWQDMNVY